MAATSTQSVSRPAFQSADKWSAHAPDYMMPTPANAFTNTLFNTMISLLDSVKPLSSPDAIFLDDGCGNGALTAHLLTTRGPSLAPNTKIIATDFSSGMIEQMNRLKASSTDPLWQKVDTRVQDAMDLESIAERSLTHVGSAMCIFMVPDPAKAIAEAYRVLAPGGAFAFSSFKKVAFEEPLEVIRDLKPDAELEVAPVPANMKTEEGVSAALTDKGFVDVQTTTGEMVMPMGEDKAAFWDRWTKSTNPGFVNRFEGWSEEERKAAVQAIAKGCDERGQSALEGTWIVVAGKKPSN